MKIITPVELRKSLIAQPDFSVIDMRKPVEFVEVHVLQARNTPLDELKPFCVMGLLLARMP
ncbi:MAG: rhodanese-like domain-containing protein [Verrucomicrobiia bacterium]|jgi:rhodanese-related sulfurtransferase